ncbi:deoxyribodipyrimidine photo-lyase [Desulfonatronum parangueonense]
MFEPKKVAMFRNVHPARTRRLSPGRSKAGPVVYWMSRDQRVRDNWALLFAADRAAENGVPLIVLFCLSPTFLNAAIRHYDFLLKGLAEVESSLRAHRIAFALRLGEVVPSVIDFLRNTHAGMLVTDFDPLRIKRQWKQDVTAEVDIPVFEVDAHNIVPCWETSPRQEYAARTIRPKIHRRLDEFLTDYPSLATLPATMPDLPPVDWQEARSSLKVDMNVPEVDWLRPGEEEAKTMLRAFLDHRLEQYEQRNDPNADVLSNLSPYLHFGQLSAQRVALEVMNSNKSPAPREAFLEELIVRRELADNFCWYNKDYDRVDGFPDWAKKTLDKHRKDSREHVYELEAFETAATHGDLWNAAQKEMVSTGKMHGYMRMYWAKKILEWTSSPEEAMSIAILLNDKYSLDGRDPNGYTGIAWSIGGVHDRPWFERPIFGQIRYMNAKGCARKFNVKSYIQRFSDP